MGVANRQSPVWPVANTSGHTCPTGMYKIMEEVQTKKDRFKEQLEEWVTSLAPWKEFFTGTFAGEYSEASAQRAFERFMKKHGSSISYFYVTEPNPSRAGHHVHAILSDTYGLSYARLGTHWFKRYGINRLEKIRSADQVTAYCAKHAGKYLLKGTGWYNFKLQDPGLWRKARKA